MRKILSVLLLIFFGWLGLVVFNSCGEGADQVAKVLSDDSVTYLVCGFDEASKNTDAILLVNYRLSDGSLSFVQIPRDTYYSYNAKTKINSIYPYLISSGVGENDAMLQLSRIISRSLAIKIDGYMGLSIEALARMIDDIGGITLDLPCDMRFENSNGENILLLFAGENHISGDEAILFIRSRNMYAMGDISRIDAQKLFISALLKKIRNEMSLVGVVSELSKLQDSVVNSHDIAGIIKILIKGRGKFSSFDARYATISGSVVQTADGVWYYSLKKKAANRLLDELGFERCGEMDIDNSFLNEANVEFVKIYKSTDDGVIIFDDNTLSEIEIK